MTVTEFLKNKFILLQLNITSWKKLLIVILFCIYSDRRKTIMVKKPTLGHKDKQKLLKDMTTSNNCVRIQKNDTTSKKYKKS